MPTDLCTIPDVIISGLSGAGGGLEDCKHDVIVTNTMLIAMADQDFI
jgi:hypothetical protein